MTLADLEIWRIAVTSAGRLVLVVVLACLVSGLLLYAWLDPRNDKEED